MIDDVKLAVMAFVALLFVGVGGFAWWEHHEVGTLQTANQGLTASLASSVATANANEVLRAAAAARAVTAEAIVAGNAKAAEDRSDTVITITKEIERAPSQPANCPAVPASFRAVARVLRDRTAASAVSGRGDQDADPASPRIVPTITIHPVR